MLIIDLPDAKLSRRSVFWNNLLFVDLMNSGISIIICHRVEDANYGKCFITKIFIFVVPH